jgi:hypothetical protein
MTYDEYETSVAKHLVASNPEYEVRYNQRLKGVHSKIARQVDILLTSTKDGHRVVVECKYYSKRISIAIVEAFISFLNDVEVKDGILITKTGISRSAVRRVAQASIRLRVLNEEDLDNYKIRGLMPHQDDRMALLREPNGWVVSPIVRGIRACCVLLPIGYSYRRSIQEGNYLYVNLTKDRAQLKARIDQEISNINAFYGGRNVHRVSEEQRFVVRRSYLSDRKRCDFVIFATFPTGMIMIHGIVRREDVAWTITNLKRTLIKSWLIKIEVESVADEKVVLRIPDQGEE